MSSGIIFQLKKNLTLSGGAFTSQLPVLPKKIVSLVPSQTELLHHLGLNEEVVGITKFCVHPNDWFRNKLRVGGTKSPDIEKIKSLQPDLVIANKEENRKEDIEALAVHFPVYVSDISTLEDALDMIEHIGQLTGTVEQAEVLVNGIKHNFALLQPASPPVRTAYLIWNEPLMAAGGDTFINDMMQRCGMENMFTADRYPETTIEYLRDHDCQLLLLSSEPFPFKEKHAAILKKALPETKIVFADGEMFSWYGSRLLQAPVYFNMLRNHY
jgi:ABC-type Fe3+-hydroxamate transport system substrate-binding protein